MDDNSNIHIHVYEELNNSYSFKNIIDNNFNQDLDYDSCITEQSLINKDNNNEKFNFYFQNRDNDYHYYNDKNNLNYFENFEYIEKSFNFIIFFNISKGEYDNFNKNKQFIKEMEKEFNYYYKKIENLQIKQQQIQPNCFFKLKLLIIVLNINELYLNEDTSELQELKLNSILKFKENIEKLLISNNNNNNNNRNNMEYIYLNKYSSKEYQKKYIIDLIFNYFSNNNITSFNQIKENYKLLLENQNLYVNENLINKLINGIQIFNNENGDNKDKSLLEFYKNFESIEYSSILKENQTIYKKVDYLKFKINENKILDKNLFDGIDYQFYENLKLIYLISRIQNDFIIVNWLSNLFYIEFEKNEKEQKNQDDENQYNIMKIYSNSLLSRCIECNCFEIFKYIYEKFENDNQIQFKLFKIEYIGSLPSGEPISPISLIVKTKNWKIINWLMDVKMDNEMKFDWQVDLLLFSSIYNNLEIFKFILNNEQSVIKIDSLSNNLQEGMTSIHYSCFYNNLNILKYIYEQYQKNAITTTHSNINQYKTIGNQYLPIHLAAKKHNYEIIDYLIQVTGADINSIDSQGYTPLYYAAYNYYHLGNIYKITFCEYLISKYNANTICTILPNNDKFDIYQNFLKPYSFCNIL